MSLLDRQATLIATLATELGVDARALRTIIRVESAGEGLVAGRPLIRLEVHHLQHLVPAAARPRVDAVFRARGPQPWEGHDWRPGPSAPWIPMHQPGASGQALEWQALELARAIDRDAADQSASWGCGQVLGSAWRELGYTSLADFVVCQGDEPGQLRTFARFLGYHGLVSALNGHDWLSVAQTYNGIRNAAVYSKKLAAAYALG